jgi:hypothetical protein
MAQQWQVMLADDHERFLVEVNLAHSCRLGGLRFRVEA